MQNNITIKISESVAPIISSRDVVAFIEEMINKADSKSVELDFSNVKFVSRSAAHALLLMKDKFSRKILRKKDILFRNASKDVIQMFRVVAANRAFPGKHDLDSKPKLIDINSLSRKFLLAK